ncbi:Nitrite reductase [NAD(P)H] [Methanimicrococcus hongohii]|uniref:Nitrite reductase [NAD(P)H] n=1 Tax=Methanimicrococcus hongohii TaxID=3028295 RepID=A0AA96VA87_9EURY|nr:NAD(P)/FAD-dependent oxidoreductase [Methanimicrococcus sp. Hf6]WNY24316.1 Nitrite reductase [NAD(P)H] [Methanimicrococcus sp. Hf6]
MTENKKTDLLEKGAIIQRDGETYAIAPHTPAGLLTPAILRNIADVAEKYDLAAIKISSSQRIVLIGLKEEEIDSAWKDLNMDPGAAIGVCVRSVRACPGTTFCKRGKQDSMSLGLKLDEKYHGMATPAKMKLAVSGCTLSCSESLIRDIGFVGDTNGFKCYVGGSAGAMPRIGDLVAEGLSEEEALAMTEKIICYMKEKNSKKRIGKYIDEIGLDEFKTGAGI